MSKLSIYYRKIKTFFKSAVIISCDQISLYKHKTYIAVFAQNLPFSLNFKLICQKIRYIALWEEQGNKCKNNISGTLAIKAPKEVRVEKVEAGGSFRLAQSETEIARAMLPQSA